MYQMAPRGITATTIMVRSTFGKIPNLSRLAMAASSTGGWPRSGGSRRTTAERRPAQCRQWLCHRLEASDRQKAANEPPIRGLVGDLVDPERQVACPLPGD